MFANERGRFDEAIADLESCLAKGLSTAKLFLRMSRSYAGLRQFSHARKLALNALELDRGSSALLEFVNLLGTRIGEENGQYDWRSFSRLSRGEIIDGLSFADFRSSYIETRASPDKGCGMFARRSIPASTLILVEKAFAVTSTLRDRSDLDQLNVAVCLKIQKNPSQAAKFFQLYAGSEYERGKLPEGAAAAISHVAAILKRNSFGSRDGCLTKACIWQNASYFNHSCIANVHRHFIGDFIVMTSKRTIEPDEELFISYTAIGENYESRKKKVGSFGFSCRCGLCDAESRESESCALQRYKLLQAFKQELQPRFDTRAFSTNKDWLLLVDQLQTLVNDICTVYEASEQEQYWYDLSEPGPALAVLQTEMGMIDAAIRTWKLLIGRCNDSEEGSAAFCSALAALLHRVRHEAFTKENSHLQDVVRSWKIVGKDPTASGYWTEMRHMWDGCAGAWAIVEDAFCHFEDLQATHLQGWSRGADPGPP